VLDPHGTLDILAEILHFTDFVQDVGSFSNGKPLNSRESAAA
jgi:hypothetical protein